jgi:hypothetical protein
MTLRRARSVLVQRCSESGGEEAQPVEGRRTHRVSLALSSANPRPFLPREASRRAEFGELASHRPEPSIMLVPLCNLTAPMAKLNRPSTALFPQTSSVQSLAMHHTATANANAPAAGGLADMPPSHPCAVAVTCRCLPSAYSPSSTKNPMPVICIDKPPYMSI